MSARAIAIAALACAACPGAPGPAMPRAPITDASVAGEDYKAWLDDGRTPSRAIAIVRNRSGELRTIDPLTDQAGGVHPGDRLLFVNQDRTAIIVVVGEQPLARAGARIIGSHIDTPAPRLLTGGITRDGQVRIKLERYGGLRHYQWTGMPVAVVGRVAPARGPEVDVSLGLDDDDFAFYVEGEGKDQVLVTSATPTKARKGYTPRTFVDLLYQRYKIGAGDLEAAELYVVPRHRARDVGVDGDLIGGHGHDDRVNAYAAWRAIVDLDATPKTTAMVWLVDREELGSTGRSGAQSRFFELVWSWLLRAEGAPATEASMARSLAASVCLSADTPAAVNPNFPEAHELKNAPVIGNGPALFPFTGRGGKVGGSAARAGLIRAVVTSFDRAGAALQHGVLGRNDAGGGGTIAKYLAERGIDAVDVGIAVVSMHSPMELVSKTDIWAAYRGFRAWLAE